MFTIPMLAFAVFFTPMALSILGLIGLGALVSLIVGLFKK